MNYFEKNELENAYKKLLSANNTKYFLTITFNKDLTPTQALDTGKALMKRIRKEYFGKNKNRDFIKGFLIFEKQKAGRPHLHFLIQDHSIFQRKDKAFQDVVIKKCKNLKSISENTGVNIQTYYKHTLEGYLTKQIKKEENCDFIKALTYDGY